MDPNVKSILISKDLHKELTEVKKESGTQIKFIVESALRMYLSKVKRKNEESN